MAKARITISIPHEQLASFKQIATNENKQVATVIANHLQISPLRPTSTQLFNAAEQVRRQYRGFLSREQAVHITSIALICLHKSADPC